MSEEFGPDFISVTDEEGNEFELELVDTLEHNGVTYYAMFPASDEELDIVYNLFMERFFEEEDEE